MLSSWVNSSVSLWMLVTVGQSTPGQRALARLSDRAHKNRILLWRSERARDGGGGLSLEASIALLRVYNAWSCEVI